MWFREFISGSILLAALLIAATVPLLLQLSHAPAQIGKPFLVVAPPWSDAGQIILKAGGVLLDRGRIDAFAVGFSPRPSFLDDLQDQGAWLVADSTLANLICYRSG